MTGDPQAARRDWWRHPWLVPAVLLAVYTLHRIWFLASGRLVLDSDEAIVGITTLDFLNLRAWHPFFLGQDYLGSFQSIAAMPFVALWGANPMGLWLAPVAQGAVALLLWRGIFRRVGLPGAWPWFALLFAIPPEFLAVWTMKARGQVEVFFLGTVWLSVYTWFFLRRRTGWRATAGWALLGATSGLAWWTSQLVAMFFLAGAAHLASVPAWRARLDLGRTPAQRAATVTAAVVYTIACFALILRGTVYYMNPWSAWLFEHRLALVASFLGTTLVYGVGAWYGWWRGWPGAFLAGFVVGYLPALVVVLGREVLYNTTGVGGLETMWVNAVALVLINGGSFIGLQDAYNEPLGRPVVMVLAVVVVYTTLLVVVVSESFRRSRRGVRRHFPEVLLLALLLLPYLFLAYILRHLHLPPHYAVTPLVGLLAVAAGGLGAIAVRSRTAAALPAALLVSVNLWSSIDRPTQPVDPWTGIHRDDAAVIDFLRGRGVTHGATSLNNTAIGYWEAYRLSFSSGESIRLHPVLHMPRVDRYREELRAASRLAFVGRDLQLVARDLEGAGLAHELHTVGRYDIIVGVDKARLDDLGLLTYAERIGDD